MLTIADALALPAFANATLVAGKSGRKNLISWAHVVDVPNAHFTYDREGVLLLTTGFGIQDDPEAQASLVPRLVEKGFAGLVLSTGKFFPKAPAIMRKQANAHNFPLIETPSDLNFIDLTEAIFEHIVNDQYALLQQSSRINKALTQVVLNGGDLNDLATTLAQLLERSVTIESMSFHVLATADYGTIDAARQESVSASRTPAKIISRLKEQNVYAQLREQMSAIRVAPMPDVGLTMERVAAPIVVNRQTHGYFWIIAGEKPLTDLDEFAIQHGATVAALILFKEQAVQQAADSQRGDLLERLLQADSDKVRIQTLARQSNVSLDSLRQVFVLDGVDKSESAVIALQQDIRRWLSTERLHGLFSWREQHFVLLLPIESEKETEALAQRLLQSLDVVDLGLMLGIGRFYPPLSKDPTAIQKSYAEATEAVAISRKLNATDPIINFHDLDMHHWLYHMPPEQRTGNRYWKHVQTIISQDGKQQTDLLNSLDAYLAHGGSLVNAAQALYIHRNTLLNRIARIEQLCDINLREPLVQTNMQLALAMYRLGE